MTEGLTAGTVLRPLHVSPSGVAVQTSLHFAQQVLDQRKTVSGVRLDQQQFRTSHFTLHQMFRRVVPGVKARTSLPVPFQCICAVLPSKKMNVVEFKSEHLAVTPVGVLGELHTPKHLS